LRIKNQRTQDTTRRTFSFRHGHANPYARERIMQLDKGKGKKENQQEKGKY
jgi:hypothetical protein